MASDKWFKWKEREPEPAEQNWVRAQVVSWWLPAVWFAFNTKYILGFLVLRGEYPESSFGLPMMLLALAVVLWSRCFKEKVQKGLRLVCTGGVAAAAAFLLYLCYVAPARNLPGNFRVVIWLYAGHWRNNFGTAPEFSADFSVSGAGALHLMILVIWLVMLAVCLKLGKRKYLMILPLLSVGVGLLVNIKPTWFCLAFLFVGIIMVLMLDNAAFAQPAYCYAALAVPVVIALLVPLVFRSKAENILEVKEEYLAFQQKLETSIKEFNFQNLFEEEAVISNREMKYKGEEMLQLFTDTYAQSNIFLRGFHGSTYKDGVWAKDMKDFSAWCRQEGIDEEEAAGILLRLHNAGSGRLVADTDSYTLVYTGEKSTTAYLPYGTNLKKGKEQVFTLQGDYKAVKKKKTEEYTVSGLKPNYTGMLTLKGSLTFSEKEFFDWYGDYVVQHYLEVPEDMTAVKEMAREILDGRIKREGTGTDAHKKAEERIRLVNLVAEKLSREYKYTLKPDRLPAGQDPVEYFLSEGKKGYCIHFASAAVLILREMGVPARYVSGYLANPKKAEFRGGKYFISVKDSAAHAWVEVYLDEYGWLPVEVTPGSGYGNDPSQMPADNTSESTESSAEDEIVESSETWEEESASSTEEESGEETGEESSEASKERPGIWGDGDGTGSGTEEASGNPAGIIIGILAVLAAGMFMLRLGKVKRGRVGRLEIYMRRGDTRRAVRLMNRYVYQKLGGGKSRMKTDSSYFGLLRKRFPQIEEKAWNQYIETVQRATYSKGRISVEDMKHCYAVYTEIMKQE